MLALLSGGKGILSSSNGPPGMACMTPKTNRDTMRSVPRIAAILAARYRPIERALLRGERATPPETVTYAPVGRVSTASPEKPRRQPMSGARRRAVRPQVSRYRAGYVGRRRRAGALDLRQPVPVCRALASRDAEVEVVDLPDQRPHLPV